MQSTKLTPGDSIEARCTKCRKNTAHVILTLGEKEPLTVECGSCARQHKYRPPSSPKKPVARRNTNSKDAERKEWETLRPSMNGANAHEYSMTGTYKVKNLINHPIFGLGLVQRVVGAQKVEVLFEDGKKMMRCK
ncbi:hypothetical protein [Geoalkalibacter halelectricus]|uniref:Uncharacterized protein n=1 Tax=Geoalkalibacter halelectricus TaxID=2847045 RepID=A0ABY5ZG16_9BACT|nr:hypothetical protein [Geoalkalibacter halelectricus]MDO3379516.1 hypothetical protein [Geoalkalibacter halelectricus]UWZ78105.1 hypothetical protein L9S41_10380 [Geoalkalibacter halelectricus]